MQQFVNKHFFELFLVTWLLGMVLYGVIGFESIDEICGVVLFAMFLFHMFNTPDWRINKVFLFTLFVFCFYLGYSLYIHSNTVKSIFIDLIIQLKPYLAFFCVYQLAPKFSKSQRKLLNDSSMLIWFLLCILGFSSFLDPRIIRKVMFHPTVFAAAVVGTSLIYLYSSNYSSRDKIIFLLMLSIGLFSGRAKFYGFWACSLVVVLYFSSPKNLSLSLKNVVILLVMFVLIVIVAWNKIELYFLQGVIDSDKAAEMDSIARFVLYATSLDIFKDYMPFGSGLGSFGTHASRVDYSPIYSEYGINHVWGLGRVDNSFIADTYYPSLAQFGVVGVCLFILFWLYLINMAFSYFKRTGNTKLMILSLLVIGYLAIENVADATFTSNRGFFMMMFLGLFLSEQKEQIIPSAEKKLSLVES